MPVRFRLPRILPALPVLFLCLSLTGCFFGGGGEAGGSDEEFELIDFGEDPTPVPVEEQVAQVGVDGLILDDLSFLYSYQVGLEDLRQLNRDFQALLEYSDPEDLGLEWVVDSHQMSALADEAFGISFGREVPPPQREKFASYYIGEIEIMQVMAFGRDRLMTAAILLGPGGRTLGSLSAEESRDFHRLIREAGFFFRDAERMLDVHIEDVSSNIGGVRLRQ